MENEEKYLDISRKLKNLEPVKASDNFVHNLHSKIVELEAEKRHEHEKRFEEGRGGFLRNLFGNMQNPWLVPAAGFTVLIFFVFYITFLNKNTSENNKDQTSSLEPKQTEQKTYTPGKDTTPENVPTEPDKSLTEEKKLPGKDIAGEFKTEKNEISPSPVEDRKSFTDREELMSKKMELKVAEPTKDEDQAETKNNDGVDFSKKENEPGETENNGMLKANPPEGETSITSKSALSRDQGDTTKRKAADDNSIKSKLDEKLLRINKTNLEKIREDIEK